MTPYAGVDYYAIDELLSDEVKMIRQSVRVFVEREAQPIIEAHHAREEFPRHLIPRMGELGLFGANLKGYGCPGLSNMAYGLVCQELERCDSGLRSFISVMNSLVIHPIAAFGSEAQRSFPADAGPGACHDYHAVIHAPHRSLLGFRPRRRG
jgi:glutaryl-CoA dehydrogenase